MSEAAELLEQLRNQGCSLYLSDGEIRIKRSGAPIPPEVVERVRDQKPSLVALLVERAKSERAARFPCPDWETVRSLGALLGMPVEVDGRSVLLWGLTARGALIYTGTVILNVDPRDIAQVHQEAGPGHE